MKNYQALVQRFQKLSRLTHAITFLQWDHMVTMPPGGAECRSEAMAELSSLHHQILTEEHTGELIAEAKQENLGPVECQSLVEMEREYAQAVCLPPDLVRAQKLAGARCEHQWRTQRQKNDWQGFLLNFREVVQLAREEARARQSTAGDRFASPYDSLLDLYCTGEDTRSLETTFDVLEENIPILLQKIMEKQAGENPGSLSGHFQIARQKTLNRCLMQCLGFDFSRGRCDESSHPFSTGDLGDQRITSRYQEEDFLEPLLATAHETGHAAYEAGLPPEWHGLPIGQARDLSIHESQSLLFEKHIFLSRPFLAFFFPAIKETLQLPAGLSFENLWSQATRVRPSLIRVEADEVTYPLHIILRFSIEKRLIDGSLEPEDIPEAWDQGMQRLLGLSTKDNFRDGCLQDMHWSDGTFGYFPSYLLGAINSAQLAAAIRKEHPDWEKRLKTGDVELFRHFLSRTIWQRGSSCSVSQMIIDATGKPSTPQALIEHLEARYLEERY